MKIDKKSLRRAYNLVKGPIWFFVAFGIAIAAVCIRYAYTDQAIISAEQGRSLFSFFSVIFLMCTAFLGFAFIFDFVKCFILNKHENYSDVSGFHNILKSYAAITFCLIAILFSIGTSHFVQALIGFHHPYRERSGTSCGYYVIAKNENGKEYTLPAEVSFDIYEDDDYKKRVMYIRQVYFPNGGYIYFDDLQVSRIDSPGRGYDQDDSEWVITLTSKYVEHDSIPDTTGVVPHDYLDFAWGISAFFYLLRHTLMYIREEKEQK